MNVAAFDCVPACKACREAGVCAAAITVRATDQIRARRFPNPHGGPLVGLPCGHLAIPWPVLHMLGETFGELYCDECRTWVKVPSKNPGGGKKNAKADRTGSIIDDEPPY